MTGVVLKYLIKIYEIPTPYNVSLDIIITERILPS